MTAPTAPTHAPNKATFPKREAPKNKSQNLGAYFHPEKVTAKTPHSPRNPPRFHHPKTTPKHLFFAKSPAKHHNSTQH
jgi:hypothetical protein